ncbi:VWA domain-containing protein [Streptomyces sp. NPDC054796]
MDTAKPMAGKSPGQITVELQISQSKYLTSKASDPQMHAILSIQVSGTEAGGHGPVLAQVLALDCSSSMAYPEQKLHAARQAAMAAIRILPDGTPFAVVGGTEKATMIYPETPEMVPADDHSRAAANQAVSHLVAAGGTCIGAWLDLSRQLLEQQHAPFGHVLLLTDGKNQHDKRMPLAGVLETCARRFVCDAWGIGEGWDARELLDITRQLHGSASAVREEETLVAEYEKLIGRLLAKTVPELAISVTPMAGTIVRYLKQVYPAEAELSPEGSTQRFVTRGWGDETRRYHLCLSVDPAGRPRREDLQLAVIALDIPGSTEARLPPPKPCVVHWTDDLALSAQTDAQVEHFEQHQRLGEIVAAATDAYRRGKRDLAEQHLGRAVQIAHAMGADQILERLARLVAIDDAPAGQVRLRSRVTAVDFEHLIAASSHSTYGPGPSSTTGATGPGSTATVQCPKCLHQAPATARFCPTCRHHFAGQP